MAEHDLEKREKGRAIHQAPGTFDQNLDPGLQLIVLDRNALHAHDELVEGLVGDRTTALQGRTQIS